MKARVWVVVKVKAKAKARDREREADEGMDGASQVADPTEWMGGQRVGGRGGPARTYLLALTLT